MLIKESQLRAIIREELIREHQELMTESLETINKNLGSFGLKALAFGLLMNISSACSDLGINNNDESGQITTYNLVQNEFDEKELHDLIKKVEAEIEKVKSTARKEDQKSLLKVLDRNIKELKRVAKRLSDNGFDTLSKKDYASFKRIRANIKAADLIMQHKNSLNKK